MRVLSSVATIGFLSAMVLGCGDDAAPGAGTGGAAGSGTGGTGASGGAGGTGGGTGGSSGTGGSGGASDAATDATASDASHCDGLCPPNVHIDRITPGAVSNNVTDCGVNTIALSGGGF